jgi:SsrA-binding protein
MHIAEYPQARDNHDPYRTRKLLAQKRQLRKLGRSVSEKGYTLVPLDVHLSGGRAKLQLGLCRGKKKYDKRQDIAKRDSEMKIRSEMKRISRGHE